MPASGRFLLRIDPDLHQRLRRAAEQTGLSLNAYCAGVLETASIPGSGAFAEPIRRAVEQSGSDLLGVVAFGSWARGHAGPSSDVDLALVLDRDVPVTRSLYEVWDRDPLYIEDLPVAPHFVHAPRAGTMPSAFWAELAMDGIVLFEHDYVVSRGLASVRAIVAEGRLVRHFAGGQSYWVEAA